MVSRQFSNMNNNQILNDEEQEWQSQAFRNSLKRKLEEAIQDSGRNIKKSASEMENQVFLRAKTKHNYVAHMARIIIFIRESSGRQGSEENLDLGIQLLQQQLQQQAALNVPEREGTKTQEKQNQDKQRPPDITLGPDSLYLTAHLMGPSSEILETPRIDQPICGGSSSNGSTSATLECVEDRRSVSDSGTSQYTEDREYTEKVNELEQYIEPLKRMINFGNQDQGRLQKMKKLLEVISNPGKFPLTTIHKCKDILKKINFPAGNSVNSEGGAASVSSLNPILDAVSKILLKHSETDLNHFLSQTFLPPLRSHLGREVTLPPSNAFPSDSEDEDEVPDVLQGEIARLNPRFKISLSDWQPSGQLSKGSIRLVCQIDDKDLPSVPTIEVTIPPDYPVHPPIYVRRASDYHGTPFLTRVTQAFHSRLKELSPHHTLTQFLTAWELSVRVISYSEHNNN